MYKIDLNNSTETNHLSISSRESFNQILQASLDIEKEISRRQSIRNSIEMFKDFGDGIVELRKSSDDRDVLREAIKRVQSK